MALNMASICRLGLLTAKEKIEDTTTYLTFLGFEIDSQSLEIDIQLPCKLTKLQVMLLDWLAKKQCTKKEIASLIGYLSHASQVDQLERRS